MVDINYDALKKKTKEELLSIISDFERKVYVLENDLEEQSKKEKELELLKFLYDDYVEVKRQNKDLNYSITNLQYRNQDLEDLCKRQQAIIDKVGD